MEGREKKEERGKGGEWTGETRREGGETEGQRVRGGTRRVEAGLRVGREGQNTNLYNIVASFP